MDSRVFQPSPTLRLNLISISSWAVACNLMETILVVIPTFCLKVTKFQCKVMHYFGDNFVTFGQNMDFNEY